MKRVQFIDIYGRFWDDCYGVWAEHEREARTSYVYDDDALDVPIGTVTVRFTSGPAIGGTQ